MQSLSGVTSPTSQAAETPQSRWAEFVALLRTVALFLFLVFFVIRGSLIEPYQIPSSSMESTLLVGDQILVSKVSYGLRIQWITHSVAQWSLPSRGDVVVFTPEDDPATPDDESSQNYIKRVIGLPGDEVEVRGTSVYINGEPYTEDDKHAQWLRGGVKDFYVERVPEGKVFLLGDNRDLSRDSRFWTDHFLDVSRIKGRAFLIYFNTRLLWNRMFRIIR